MKDNIHPEYFDSEAACTGCGNKFTVGSTKATISMSVCSKCHPFFTGNLKFVDAAGRIERFQQKYANAGKPAAKKVENATPVAAKAPKKSK